MEVVFNKVYLARLLGLPQSDKIRNTEQEGLLTMRVTLYTLEKLAEKEKVNYDYLRSNVVPKYKRREIEDWRGWHFVSVPQKCNLAYKPIPGVEVRLVR
jgi:hypothetical protein